MNIIQAWRAWRAIEEVKKMDKKGIAKLVLAVVAALATSAGVQLGAGDAVSYTDLISVGFATLLSYLANSPLAKKE